MSYNSKSRKRRRKIKKNIICILFLLFLVLGSLLFSGCAQNVQGRWFLYVVEDDGDSFYVTASISQSGGTLSGTWLMGNNAGIIEGSISGKNFEFVGVDQTEDVIKITGSVENDQMSGSYYSYITGDTGYFSGQKS